VDALIREHPASVETLWLREGNLNRRLVELAEAARAVAVPVRRAPAATLERLAGERHQGAVARVWQRDLPGEKPLLDHVAKVARAHPPLLLVLEGLDDPRNLGACLRSAEGAGVDAVVLTRHRGSPVSAAVRRTAAGATESLDLFAVRNLARAMQTLSAAGIWLVGTAGEAPVALYDCDFRRPLALVLGSEGKGLRRLTRERCDELVSIPLAGRVSSLNVSVAAGICLFEARRQRGTAAP